MIAKWLEVGGPNAPSTRMVYDGYIKRQIEPHIGTIRLDRLKVSDLDAWYLTMRDAGLKPASIRKAHNIVRGALSQGLRWGWVQVNVAAMSKPPTMVKPVIPTPKASQVKALIAFVEQFDREFATYIRLAGVTGARPGEMCGLQWRDLDFESGELHVRRRIMRSSTGMFPEDLTKTGKTRRVPLDPNTMQWIRDHRRVCEVRARQVRGRLDDEAFVFAASADGRVFWRPDSVNRKFQYFRSRAGLPSMPLYALRHQAATTMIDGAWGRS